MPHMEGEVPPTLLDSTSTQVQLSGTAPQAIESVRPSCAASRKARRLPNQASLLKVLCLALMKAQERWTMSIRECPPALYHFSLAFPGRCRCNENGRLHSYLHSPEHYRAMSSLHIPLTPLLLHA